LEVVALMCGRIEKSQATGELMKVTRRIRADGFFGLSVQIAPERE
jgi:hypothetical protein